MEKVMLKNKLCYAECPYLISRQEDYDDEPMGYCSLKNDRYIGSMDNIYTSECDCLDIPK